MMMRMMMMIHLVSALKIGTSEILVYCLIGLFFFRLVYRIFLQLFLFYLLNALEALFLVVLLFSSHLSTSHQLLLLELLMKFYFSLDSALLYPCPCPAVSSIIQLFGPDLHDCIIESKHISLEIHQLLKLRVDLRYNIGNFAKWFSLLMKA